MMPSNDLVAMNDIPLGPCMLALKPVQQAFVEALVERGCTPMQAGAAVGITPAMAKRLAQNDRVLAAIREVCARHLASGLPAALRVVTSIMNDAKAKNADRLKATSVWLERLMPITTHQHIVVEHIDDAEKDREILTLARELGLDDAATAKLLGHQPPPVIAATAQEIDPETGEVIPRPIGRPVTNFERTDAERAAVLARLKRTPDERAARRAEFAEEQRARQRAIYRTAWLAREAKRLGLSIEDITECDGLEEILGLNLADLALEDDVPIPATTSTEGNLT